MSPPLLRVQDLSVGFESLRVLDDISFDVPRRGILGLLGPAGVGKSTMLRTLARWNDPLPSFWTRGDIRWSDGTSYLHDTPVARAHQQVPLLFQKAALYTANVLDNAIAAVRRRGPATRDEKRALAFGVLDPLGLWDEYEPVLDRPVLSLSIGQQRKLSIARLIGGGAVCLLADEPLRDIDEREALQIQELLAHWSKDHAAVVVSHSQRVARRLCADICVFAAGRLVETGPAESFFAAPRTRLGADFVRLGNCWPSGDAGDEVPASPPPPSTPPRPGGFHWVINGRLGGMQQPGLLRDETQDLNALNALGCKMLVTLTESAYSNPLLDQLGIRAVHVPIPDMGAPSVYVAASLCRRVSEWLGLGHPTVMHCKAGLGRTGTMLACMLVYAGHGAVRAIDHIRSINTYYIQSNEQTTFVGEFEDYIRSRRGEMEPNPEIWKMLGGRDGMLLLLEDFYARVYADLRLAHLFEGVPRHLAIERQYRFLSNLFEGKQSGHESALNIESSFVISDELFNRREQIMAECLRHHGLPEHLLVQWTTAEEISREQIVRFAPIWDEAGGGDGGG